MSPILFSFNGFQIRYFGLFYAVGLILLFVRVNTNLKTTDILITRDELLNWMIVVFFYGIIGARLYYVLFNLEYYFNPGQKWYEFLAVWNGGLGLNGGVLASILALLVLCHNKKVRFDSFIDQVAVPFFLAMTLVCLGRFINSGSLELFLNGENPSVFHILLSRERIPRKLYHPTELYGSILYSWGYLIFGLGKWNRFKAGFLSCCCLAYYSLVRVCLSFTEQVGLTLSGTKESFAVGLGGAVVAIVLILAGKLYLKRPLGKKQYPSTRKWNV